ILKADVDNLGLIFNKGFENPLKSEEGLEDINRKTTSRFLTLSRMLELFFSGWMKDVMINKPKNEIVEELAQIKGIDQDRFKKYLSNDYINFENIYTVYSGGDDLILVAPWETMIIFAIYLNQQFRKYTCNNDFITLSAGLTFVKDKHPIASAIKQAEALLEKSKEDGKNRITLFGTTIEWEKYPELINFFLFLNKILDNSEINTAFLYRLLKYHQMALTYLDEGKVEGLKYLSNLSYEIGRKIIIREEDERIKKDYIILHKLINEKPNKDSLIYNLKIPIFWALYRHREAI
ncbi:MAG: hypothetical protein HY934_10990, partial [Candidatus Firestonebacteria bacterium]|nr:hypothetical protein [Candidatus Firestonebacteria bacterium]